MWFTPGEVNHVSGLYEERGVLFSVEEKPHRKRSRNPRGDIIRISRNPGNERGHVKISNFVAIHHYWHSPVGGEAGDWTAPYTEWYFHANEKEGETCRTETCCSPP